MTNRKMSVVRNKGTWAEIAHPTVREMAKQLLTPTTVLDVGCGQGRNAFFLADLGHTVRAIDSSAQAIKQVRELARDYSPGKVLPQLADIRDLHWLQLPYCGVAVINVLHFLTKNEAERSLVELQRLVAPGGHLALVGFSASDPAARTAELADRGFLDFQQLLDDLAELEIISAGHYAKDDPGHPGCDQPHVHYVYEILAKRKIDN